MKYLFFILCLLIFGCDSPTESSIQNCNNQNGFALRSNYYSNAQNNTGMCFMDSNEYNQYIESYDLMCPEYYKEFECQYINNEFNLSIGQKLYFYIYLIDENQNYNMMNPNVPINIDITDSSIISAEYCEEEDLANWDPFLGQSHPCAGADYIHWGSGAFGSSYFQLSSLMEGETTFTITFNLDNQNSYTSLPISVNISN